MSVEEGRRWLKRAILGSFTLDEHNTLEDARTAAAQATSTGDLYPGPEAYFKGTTPETSSSRESATGDNKTDKVNNFRKEAEPKGGAEAPKKMPALASEFFQTSD
jgi:hypothetical protein